MSNASNEILREELAKRLYTDSGPGGYGRPGSMITKADDGAHLSPMPRFAKITGIGDGSVFDCDVLDPDESGNTNTLPFPSCAVGDVIEFRIARVRTTTTATYVVGY